MFNHDLQMFINFGLYVLMSFVALSIFLKLFVLITPTDDFKRIKEGDLCPSITLSGAMIGFTIPLLICSFLESGPILFIELALLIGFVQLLLEKLISYWLVEKNAAISIFHATLSICVGAIIGFSIIP